MKQFWRALILSFGLLTLASHAALADAQRHNRLAQVQSWYYHLGFELEGRKLRQIAESGYDMLVIEPIYTEAENTDFPIADTLRQLRTRDRLIFAYIDIGQAEEWRTYWQRGWRVGAPAWIVAEDPDGWDGNYPVAFWHTEWKRIWLGQDGLVADLARAGFDGVYLDWVEAYSDDAVVAAANRDGKNPQREMIRFVGEIAAAGRAVSRDFMVISQNAAELASNRTYARSIDGQAQEQVWFDGAADNRPRGDCPLPATEADIDTRSYERSLSRACRDMYETYPESTLHVSSEGYIEDLRQAQANGLVVFTVDYTVKQRNIRAAIAQARQLGFVPFTGERALDSFHPPY